MPSETVVSELTSRVDLSDPILELVDVRASYDAIEVLKGVNLSVAPGHVVALLGPNGGGKSTTLRICSGLLKPTHGEFRLAGRVMNGAKAEDIARLGVCSIPEGRGIFPNLTVRENLWLVTGTGASREHVETVAYERFPILSQRREQLAGSMSGGEQQMLAVCRALAVNPEVLLLDELSMGVAPIIVADMYRTVAQVAAEGVAVLLAEQFARTVLPLATSAALMLQGRVVFHGDPGQISEELAASYLGG